MISPPFGLGCFRSERVSFRETGSACIPTMRLGREAERCPMRNGNAISIPDHKQGNCGTRSDAWVSGAKSTQATLYSSDK